MPGARAAVEVVDERSTLGHVRFSWHPTAGTVIVSAWRDGVCVASNRVPLGELPALIALFAQALAHRTGGDALAERPTLRSIGRDVSTVGTAWFTTARSAAWARRHQRRSAGGWEDAHPRVSGAALRWLDEPAEK